MPVRLWGASVLPMDNTFIIISGYTGYEHSKSIFWYTDNRGWDKLEPSLNKGYKDQSIKQGRRDFCAAYID